MKLIIAEKPSVARSIAKVIGARQIDGYYEGNGYYVANCIGHLFQPYDVVDYTGNKDWKIENFPFIPDEFKFKPIDDEGIKHQIDIIRMLIEKSDEIIAGLDRDREGQAILCILKKQFQIKLPIKTLWLDSHTPEDIINGLKDLKEDKIHLQAAGISRLIMDWLIGINFTTLFTLKAGGGKTLKIGRTILATLRLMYDREAEIINFKSSKRFKLEALFEDHEKKYVGLLEHDIPRSELEQLKAKIDGKCGEIVEVNSEVEKKKAPRLFSLTDCQAYITEKYSSFTGNEVLEIIQKLYERKFVTYPRTESRYLNVTMIEETKIAMENVASKFEVSDQVIFHTNKSVFNDQKVNSHTALTPTQIVPKELSDKEWIVYKEIAKRFLSQFIEPLEYNLTTVVTMVDNIRFISKFRNIVELGWSALYQKDISPSISFKRGKVKTDGVSIKTIESKPKGRYTEGTLIKAMENCGAKISEEDVLRGFKIGTGATRSETVQKLIELNYINKNGKSLKITKLGLNVVKYFPVRMFIDVNFTGKIEMTLSKISSGEYNADEFMKKIEEVVRVKAEEMKKKDIPIIATDHILGRCPECNNKIIENAKAFSCSKSSCNFVIWKKDKFFEYFRKRMTKEIASKLLNCEKVLVKGLTSPKTNKKFDAYIRLVKDSEKWRYDMNFDEIKKKKKYPKRRKKATNK